MSESSQLHHRAPGIPGGTVVCGVVAVVPVHGPAPWWEVAGRTVLDLLTARVAPALADLDVPLVTLPLDRGAAARTGERRRADALLAAAAGEGPAPALLVLDPACPLVPADHVRALVAAARAGHDGPVVSVRPVSDTVKAVERGGRITATVPRDDLVAVASPLLLPAGALGRPEELTDLPGLVDRLVAAGARPVLVDAPAAAARVGDPASLAVLAAVAGAGPTG